MAKSAASGSYIMKHIIDRHSTHKTRINTITEGKAQILGANPNQYNILQSNMKAEKYMSHSNVKHRVRSHTHTVMNKWQTGYSPIAISSSSSCLPSCRIKWFLHQLIYKGFVGGSRDYIVEKVPQRNMFGLRFFIPVPPASPRYAHIHTFYTGYLVGFTQSTIH